MSNIPRSLCDSSLTLFRLTISGPHPWPFSHLLRVLISESRSWNEILAFNVVIIGFITSAAAATATATATAGRRRKKEMKDVVPKGFLAVMVGKGQEKQRFVVPLVYLNHPLFVQLLKEAEEEYGFGQKGPISIPCNVEQFQNVQRIIEGEQSHHHHHCF